MKGFNQNKNYIIIATCVLVVSILSLSCVGFTMSDNNRNTLVLLGNENLAPIVYNDNGTAKGVAVDLAKAIGDNIGYEIKVMAVNWAQAQTMVLNGEAEGLLQINPSPERNELYNFLGFKSARRDASGPDYDRH
ncbi:MAG: transporter substrate-binding domain-containing protein [Firmicutes bacterium]|nr:transporter substrate-binding domain-containing protein [Bacillota bacterium]